MVIGESGDVHHDPQVSAGGVGQEVLPHELDHEDGEDENGKGH